MAKTIHFYTTTSGRCPVEEFLNALTGKQAQKVTWVLRLVEELDVVPAQYFQKMAGTDDLWEVRVKVGANIFRILGFCEESRLVILVHAVQKKTQKTPRQAIRLAEERRGDYLKRRTR